MKTTRFLFWMCLVALGFSFALSASAANTAGSATFSVTTSTYSAQYAPNHVVVVWVVDGSNKFVKTLCRHAGSRIGYLSRWATARGSYTNVDGTTSATLTRQPTNHVVVWNCRDTNGAVVPDGMYYFKVEYTSINGAGPYLTNGVGFMKGTAPVTTNFANSSSLGGTFSGLAITYTPSLPDVAAVTLTPGTGYVNSNVAVVVGITNLTSTATPTFTVALSNLTSGATLIGTQQVASLAASGSTNVTIVWNTAGLSAGAYQMKAQAFNLAGETNLANNAVTNTVNLSATVHDVGVAGISVGGVVPPGVTTNVTVSVNNGGGFAETFSLVLSDTTSAQTIGTRTVTNLPIGATSNVVFAWNTTPAAIGYHTLQAVAGTVAGETQTANNSNALTVIVANGLETNALVAKGATWKYLDSGLDISGGPWTQFPENYYDGFWMPGPAPFGFGTTGIATPLGTAPTVTPGTILAADAASNAVYAAAWVNGANGGSGFGAWQLSASGSGGHFTGSSTLNAGGASGGIDTGGRTWGLWASSGVTEAVRPLTGGPLVAGQVLRAAFDNGWIDNGGTAGIGLRNAAGNTLWEFYFAGGTNNYYLNDQGGSVYTAIPFTGDGLQMAFQLTDPTNYVVEVTRGGVTQMFSGSLIAQADAGIAQVRCWNNQAGSGSNADVFLNSLSVSNEPTYSDTTNSITTYFRKEFTMDFAPIAVSGLVRMADGVVLYLNGQEIDRQNMPAAVAVNAATLASAAQSGAAAVAYAAFAIAPSNLLVGRNQLAAEVHLASAGADARVFDLELKTFNSIIARTYTIVPTALRPDGDIQAGDRMGVTVSLTNTSNAATTCTLLIRDAATGAILASRAAPLLVAGESASVHLAWPTLGSATGDRILQVATVINGVTNWSATVSNTVTVAAQDYAPRGVNATGSIGGRCGAVAVSGQTVYMGCGSTLEIWNLQAPFNPIRVGSVRLPGLIEGLAVSGSTVYAATGASGVQVVDATTPAAPVHVATFDTSGNARRLALAGTTLYVADGLGGVRALDVTVPSAPVLVGAYATAGAARSLVYASPYLYVLDMDDGLQILTAAATPVLVGENRLITAGLGLAGVAGAVIVSDANGGLFKVTTTNAAAPVIAAQTRLASAGVALAAAGPALYVAAGTAGLLTVDPATLAVVDTDAVNGEAADVALSGTILLVATGFGGCQAWDVSSPLAPVLLGTLRTGVRAVDADRSGDTLFLAGDEAGFQVHSLADPAAPEWVATVASSTNPRCLLVSGSLAYVAETSGGLKIYDISNPAAPSLVGTDPASGLVTVRRLALSGTRLALTDGRQINLLDVSNPAIPVQLASNVPPGYVFDLAANATHVFAACGGAGLRILDNATLGTVGTYATTPAPAISVALSGTQAFVGDGQATFRTLDIGNPAAPSLVQSSAGAGFGLATVGANLIGVGGQNQGAVLDVAAPLTPVSVLNLSNLTFALRVRAQGDLVLVAEDEAGLSLFALSSGDANLNGIPDTVDQQIVDADPEDAIHTIWDVLPGDDFDGDGTSNLAESLAGTSAVDENSFFAISAATSQAGGASGQFVVRWYSELGKTYTIHQSTNLAAGFSPLQAGIPDSAPINSYTAAVSTATTYYMISVP